MGVRFAGQAVVLVMFVWELGVLLGYLAAVVHVQILDHAQVQILEKIRLLFD